MKNDSLSLSHPKYRPDIDGLRAIAVISVIGFHAFPNWVKGGFIGVDIFFVISGFLISTILFENIEKGTFSLAEFYIRRIIRIFPALLIVLAFCYAFGWFALLSDEYKQLGKHIAAGAGFFSNFSFWREAGYFDNAADTKPLLHLWSLGIEEQFYIAWPLLLWIAWKKKLNLFTLTLIVALVSFYLNIKEIRKDIVATFYSPQTRFWELQCGSLLAWQTLYQPNACSSMKNKLDSYLCKNIFFRQADIDEGNTLSNVKSFIGLLFIAYGICAIAEDTKFPGMWALFPTLGAVLIISAGMKSWLNQTALSNPVLVWIGLISYPLYLWHWPFLSFAHIVESEAPSTTILVVAMLLTIILAWLTYIFVEKPVRFGNNSKRKSIILFMLMIFVGLAGHITNRCDGFTFRVKMKNQHDLLDIIAHPLPPVKGTDCGTLIPEFKELSFDGECKLSKNSAPTIMFVGDSHTIHFRNAIWKNFSSETVLLLAETSCLPFSSNHFLKDTCKNKYDAVIKFLEKNSSIKTVYLSGYWSYLMAGGYGKHGLNWRIAKPLTNEGARSFKENGATFISRIIKTNKEVVFMKDIPDLDFDIQSCFAIRPLKLKNSENINHECSWDIKKYRERIDPYDKIVNQTLDSFPNIKIYDPRSLFCKDGKCFASDGSLPYYFNGDHVNHFGADMVIKDLLRNMMAVAKAPG